MKTTAAASFIFSLFPLALAQSPVPFSLIAARSTSPIHLQSINANDLGFWIGKSTQSFCPSDVSDCPPGEDTAFVGGDVTLSLDVEVPGGQQVYVASSGALMFTAPHSAAIPEGATLTGFTKSEGPSFGVLSWDSGFLACPTGGPDVGPWQIFGAIDGFNSTGCLGFDALAPNGTGVAAWEYE